MTFKPVLPLVDYAVNYDYISEVLCINKNKPELKCNGKCHLMSELAKASDEQNSSKENSQNTSIKLSQVEFICNHFIYIPSLQNNLEEDLETICFENTYTFLHSNAVFHPPLA